MSPDHDLGGIQRVRVAEKKISVLYLKKKEAYPPKLYESVIKTTLLSWQTIWKRLKRIAHKTCVRKPLTDSMQKLFKSL